MNKSELIAQIAKQGDIPKAHATRALEATLAVIKIRLRKGDVVALNGFGSFQIGKRSARTGRNPRTGATVKIKAQMVPKFKPSKALKDAVN